RSRDVGAADHPRRTEASGAVDSRARPRRRASCACRVDRGPLVMKKYQKPAELYDGLRLHQNENTGGCSPRVLESLASLRPDQIGFYPAYEAATAACAHYLGVHPDRLSLLNGLDEGIMATSVAC